MSRNLVHAAHVFNNTSILTDVTNTPEQRNAAARYLGNHAPDLADMILGGAA